MISIHLTTSGKSRHRHVATATVDGQTFTATEAKRSPIHVLARKLVASGIDASRRAQVYRGEVEILRKPVPLASWISKDVTDSDTTGLRIHAFRPFDGIGASESSAA
jgi:hypothetical protein